MLKLGNDELQQERQLSQLTMENIQEAVYWIDAGQHIIHVNEAACRMSGYTKEELIQETIWLEGVNDLYKEPDGFGGFNSLLLVANFQN